MNIIVWVTQWILIIFSAETKTLFNIQICCWEMFCRLWSDLRRDPDLLLKVHWDIRFRLFLLITSRIKISRVSRQPNWFSKWLLHFRFWNCLFSDWRFFGFRFDGFLLWFQSLTNLFDAVGKQRSDLFWNENFRFLDDRTDCSKVCHDSSSLPFSDHDSQKLSRLWIFCRFGHRHRWSWLEVRHLGRSRDLDQLFNSGQNLFESVQLLFPFGNVFLRSDFALSGLGQCLHVFVQVVA